MPMEIVYGLLPVYDPECMCGVHSMILHIFTCWSCIKCMETDYFLSSVALSSLDVPRFFFIFDIKSPGVCSYWYLNRWEQLLVRFSLSAVAYVWNCCFQSMLLVPPHSISNNVFNSSAAATTTYSIHTHRYKQYLPFNSNLFIRLFFLALPIFRLFLFVSHNGEA